jgi:Uma2 family endonuclease
MRDSDKEALTASAGTIVFEERLRVPGDVFSLEKFREWAHSGDFPKSGWVSYIGGEIEVEMSPEEIETHNKVKVCVCTGISIWIEPRNMGEVLGDRAFLVNDEADLATEPDLIFCSWDALRSGRVRYSERVKGSDRFVEVTGTPDLVVEVVSEFSRRKDRVLLPVQYFHAGIPEYWIVDARGEELEFTVLSRGPQGYVAVDQDTCGYFRSTVLGGSFRITRGRNPVGGYAYKLLGSE